MLTWYCPVSISHRVILSSDPYHTQLSSGLSVHPQHNNNHNITYTDGSHTLWLDRLWSSLRCLVLQLWTGLLVQVWKWWRCSLWASADTWLYHWCPLPPWLWHRTCGRFWLHVVCLLIVFLLLVASYIQMSFRSLSDWQTTDQTSRGKWLYLVVD